STPEGLTFSSYSSGNLKLIGPSEPKSVAFSPEPNSSPLILHFVEEGEFTDVDFRFLARGKDRAYLPGELSDTPDLRVGDSMAVVPLGSVGMPPLCGNGLEATIRTLTPEVCHGGSGLESRVESRAGEVGFGGGDPQRFLAWGITRGDCQLELILPRANHSA